MELSEDRVRDALLQRCRSEQVEPPRSSRIGRVLGAARAGHESDFTTRTVARLSPASCDRLEELDIESPGDEIGAARGFLAELKADPGRVGLKTLLSEIEKLQRVPAIGLPRDLFVDASERQLAAWRARADASSRATATGPARTASTRPRSASRSTGVVPRDWRAAVIDDTGRVERIPYELCVLRALRDAIRRREISIVGANRWRDPEDDLPSDFESNRDVHYASLRQPLDAAAFIVDLQSKLTAALSSLDRGLADGTTGNVRIMNRRGEPWIVARRSKRCPSRSRCTR